MTLQITPKVPNMFKPSAEDSEVLGFYGDRRIPQSSGGEKNLLFDDFEGAALDNTKWTGSITGNGSITVSGSTVILNSGTTGGGFWTEIKSKVRSLRQIVGGDIIIEAKVKVNFSGDNGLWKIGLTDNNGTDLAYIGKRLNNANEHWKPRIEKDGVVESGVEESTADDSYLKIKIILGLYKVKFYIDDVLVETLDAADSVPNDQEMFVIFRAEQSISTIIMTIDWAKFQYIGIG